MKRKPVPRRQSSKKFSRTAGSNGVRKTNHYVPMRGGIRL